jgi:hypothetical protein
MPHIFKKCICYKCWHRFITIEYRCILTAVISYLWINIWLPADHMNFSYATLCTVYCVYVCVKFHVVLSRTASQKQSGSTPLWSAACWWVTINYDDMCLSTDWIKGEYERRQHSVGPRDETATTIRINRPPNTCLFRTLSNRIPVIWRVGCHSEGVPLKQAALNLGTCTMKG